MRNVHVTPQDTTATLATLKHGVTLVGRPQQLFRLTGKDPVGMLNAILTNDVPKESSQGVYAMLLNPKGRVQTDLRVLKSGEDVLITTAPEGADAAKEILGRYAPFSRVKLEELPDWSVLGLYGGESGKMLGLGLAEHETAVVEIGGEAVLAAGVARPIPGHDLVGSRDSLNAIHEYLTTRGAVPASREAYETVRIEAGVPCFGADITPDNFPGETGLLERVVSFQKGCYPGQETVARMHYRGHPNKDLHRFSLKSADVIPGVEILQSGKAVGTITSVAPLTVGGKTFALGYLSRKADLEAPMTAGDVPVVPLGPVRG